LPRLRRGGGGRQAGAAVLSCLVRWCEFALTLEPLGNGLKVKRLFPANRGWKQAKAF